MAQMKKHLNWCESMKVNGLLTDDEYQTCYNNSQNKSISLTESSQSVDVNNLPDNSNIKYIIHPVTNKYLACDENGSLSLVDINSINDPEICHWTIAVKDDYTVIRSAKFGNYITVEKDGTVTATSTQINTSTKFNIQMSISVVYFESVSKPRNWIMYDMDNSQFLLTTAMSQNNNWKIVPYETSTQTQEGAKRTGGIALELMSNLNILFSMLVKLRVSRISLAAKGDIYDMVTSKINNNYDGAMGILQANMEQNNALAWTPRPTNTSLDVDQLLLSRGAPNKMVQPLLINDNDKLEVMNAITSSKQETLQNLDDLIRENKFALEDLDAEEHELQIKINELASKIKSMKVDTDNEFKSGKYKIDKITHDIDMSREKYDLTKQNVNQLDGSSKISNKNVEIATDRLEKQKYTKTYYLIVILILCILIGLFAYWSYVGFTQLYQ